MNMKKIFYVFLVAALVTVVATNFLGNKDTDTEELLYNGKTYDSCLTELKEINAPLTLLKEHSAVSNTMVASDPDGVVLGTYQTQYARTEEGNLLFTNTGLDAQGNEIMLMNGYKEGSNAGAYYMLSGEQKSMTLYPSAEYEAYVANNSALDLTQQGYTEMAVEVKEEKGELVIVSVLQMADSKEASRITYFADSATMKLSVREIVTYEGEDIISQSRTEYVYDSEYTEEHRAAEAVLTEDGEGCLLSLTLLENGEVLETQSFTVDRECGVTFLSEKEFKMYTDEKLKKKLKSIDVSGDTAQVYIVLENEDEK